MKIGCFALVEPFAPMRRQFEAIREMGFEYADLTDNHDGATLGTEFGFGASISLDAHPDEIEQMVGDAGLTLTAVCAHANLLDPVAPSRYGTHEIIRAIRLAHLLGVKQVVTTEGEAKTSLGHALDPEQMLLSIRLRLDEPIRWARRLGIELLLEPHGPVTDSIDMTGRLIEALDADDVVGLNLDTGNCWLGGTDPAEYVRTFTDRIRHVHWKDMPAEWEPKRGKMFGCGMATIPLGDGIVGIERVVNELKRVGFDGPTTLEVAGVDNVKQSAQRLQQWVKS